MFITDGIEGDYAGQESFEKNNKDKRVRVFSYLVGRMKSPDKKALIKMACENGGHFYTIDTLGNVWDTILDYLRVMSRPITHAINDGQAAELKAIYTHAYLDSAGFGMVMSVSRGVLDKEILADGSVVYKHLIGVAGTDISLTNLTSLMPYSKMGVFSRAFVINNNGFVLIHPRFREQTGYLPVPPNVLMEDLELSIVQEDAVKLKEEMLGKNVTANRKFKTYWTYDNNKRFNEIENEYTFQKIPGTEFIAAVAIAETDKQYHSINKNTMRFDQYFKDGINALDAPDYGKTNKQQPTASANNSTNSSTLAPETEPVAENSFSFVEIAPWNYCDINNAFSVEETRKHLTAADLYRFLSNSTQTLIKKSCDEELLDRLLVMAGAIDNITKTNWNESSRDDVDSLFVATSGGYQRFYTFNKQSKPFARDILRSRLFENTVASNKDASLIFTTPVKDSTDNRRNDPVDVTLVKPFWKNGILASGKFLQHFSAEL
jgi:Cache domain.